MAKKKRISKEIIDQLHSPDAIKEWCKAYKVNEPGDEPNTKAAFGIPFEKSGILPYGWPVNPYDTALLRQTAGTGSFPRAWLTLSMNIAMSPIPWSSSFQKPTR